MPSPVCAAAMRGERRRPTWCRAGQNGRYDTGIRTGRLRKSSTIEPDPPLEGWARTRRAHAGRDTRGSRDAVPYLQNFRTRGQGRDSRGTAGVEIGLQNLGPAAGRLRLRVRCPDMWFLAFLGERMNDRRHGGSGRITAAPEHEQVGRHGMVQPDQAGNEVVVSHSPAVAPGERGAGVSGCAERCVPASDNDEKRHGCRRPVSGRRRHSLLLHGVRRWQFCVRSGVSTIRTGIGLTPDSRSFVPLVVNLGSDVDLRSERFRPNRGNTLEA